MELEVTWNRTVHVWWAYLWRSLVAIVAGVAVSMVVGIVGGVVLKIAGVSPGTTQAILLPIGFAVGLLASIVPVKMILGKDFGEFRVVLVTGRDWQAEEEDIFGRRVENERTGGPLW